jgi:hypothetical protein
MALALLDEFDEVFPHRINNSSGCQIGSAKADVDFNKLLRDAHLFYEIYQKQVTDCKVNHFLGLRNPKGKLKVFLNDHRAAKLDVVKRVAALATPDAWIACRACGSIGDVVIALEQPASHCLVHVDHSFNELCRCRNRRNLALLSIKGVDKSAEEPKGKEI